MSLGSIMCPLSILLVSTTKTRNIIEGAILTMMDSQFIKVALNWLCVCLCHLQTTPQPVFIFLHCKADLRAKLPIPIVTNENHHLLENLKC